MLVPFSDGAPRRLSGTAHGVDEEGAHGEVEGAKEAKGQQQQHGAMGLGKRKGVIIYGQPCTKLCRLVEQNRPIILESIYLLTLLL